MNRLSEENSPTLEECLEHEIMTMLKGITLEEVAMAWPEYHFVPFSEIAVGTEFRIAGVDRNKGTLIGFKKVTETVCQKMHTNSRATMSLESVMANVRHEESGAEDKLITHHRFSDNTPVILA